MTEPGRRPLPQRPPPGPEQPAPAHEPAPPQPATKAAAASPVKASRWAAAKQRAAAQQQVRPQVRSRHLPGWLDAHSWGGATVLMCGFAAVLWVVELIDLALDHRLDRFGIRPRAVAGLWGIATQPFLHQSIAAMARDTLPVILIGWVVMLAGLRSWSVVTAAIVVLGGLVTWLIGPAGSLLIGASSLVFGWMGYLLARAVFSRRIKWILVAAAVLFFYGTLLAGLFPSLHSRVTWQANVAGFVAGLVVGAVLHPRGRDSRLSMRSAVV